MEKVIVNNDNIKIPYVVPETKRIQVEMEDGFLVASASAGATYGGQIDPWSDGGDNTTASSGIWSD
jgi:hypothetical protein